MEVYTSQPNSEVLKCQQHVVPNLKIHHTHPQHPHHRHSHRPLSLQINKNSQGQVSASSTPAPPNSALASSSSATTITPKTTAASTTTGTATAPPAATDMKRSYDKTKEPPASAAGAPSSRPTITTQSNKCSVIRHTANLTPNFCAANNSNINSANLLPINKSKSSTSASPARSSSSKQLAKPNNNNNGSTCNGINTGISPARSASDSAVCTQEDCLSTTKGDVFLGGSCNPTTWRTDIAIPLLQKLGISYYNPQVSSWCPELIALEHEAKTNAKFLLFVIDNQTRSVVTMIEVAFLAAQGRKVVLVLPNQDRKSGQAIMGEVISPTEFEELSAAHLLLKRLVERHEIPVLNDIVEAIHWISNASKQSEEETTQSPLNLDVKNLRASFQTFSNVESEEMSNSNILKAYKALTHKELSKSQIKQTLENLGKVLSQNGNGSSGEDSPPHKKDLLGEVFSTVSANLEKKNGGNTKSTLSFEEFQFLMNKLCLAPTSETTTTLALSKKKFDLIQTARNVLDKLLADFDFNSSTSSSPASVSPSVKNKPSVFPITNGSTISRDIYFGNCISNCTRKSEKIIPLFKKNNLSFCSFEFARASAGRTLSSDVIDLNSIDESRVLFLYMNNSARAVELMTLAAYYMGLNRHRIVFCIEDLEEDCQAGDEKLTKLAIKDYNRGRSYTADIATRNEFTVLKNLDEALQKVVQLCKTS